MPHSHNISPINKNNVKKYAKNNKVTINFENTTLNSNSLYTNKYLLKGLVNKMNMGLLITDKDFIIKQCTNMKDYINHSTPGLYNKNVFDAFPFLRKFVDVSKYQSFIKSLDYNYICPKIFQSKFPPFYYKYRKEGSAYLHLEISFYPFMHKSKLYTLFIFKDVSYLDVYLNIFKKYKKQQTLIEKIESTSELKTNFYTNITHELKTPINVILSAIQLLNLNIENEISLSDEKVKKYYACIQQNSFRLVKIINNLMDINKIESGYLKLDMRNCNIINIVEDITLSIASYIEDKNISLIFDTDIEEKVIACDPDKIERIVLNLISNSVKFTNPGGTIKVQINNNKHCIKISISDTGIGIPENKLGTIFDRFAQVESSNNRNKYGSGIGLSLVKYLVEMHNGTIELKSKVNEGTTVVISLPNKKIKNDCNSITQKNLGEDLSEKISVEFSNLNRDCL